MKVIKPLLLGVVWIGVALCVNLEFSHAQESDDYLMELLNVRDPFASQLPPPKIVPVVKPQIVKPVEVVEPPKPIENVNNVPKGDFVTPAPTTSNPFASKPQTRVSDVGSFVIRGLVWNTPLPQAIVDNQILKIGDQFRGMQILSIGRTGVEFSNNGVKVKAGISDK